jgi:hypothetical protein
VRRLGWLTVKVNNQDLCKGSLHLVIRQVIKFEADPFLEESLERGVHRRAGAEEAEIAQQWKPRNEGFIAFVSEIVENPAEGRPCALDKREPGAWVLLMAQRVVDDGIDSETRLFLCACWLCSGPSISIALLDTRDRPRVA